jgi:hypothetical protein
MVLLPQLPQFEDAGMRGNSRLLRILQPLSFLSHLGRITAPAGFVTDGASIPRVFHPILGPHGSYFPAAIIHDWLYSVDNELYTRYEADRIFLEAMILCNVGVVTRQMVYAAVRLGGRWAFKSKVR